MSRLRFPRSGAALSLAALIFAALAAPVSEAQPKRQPGTRIGLNYPGRTDAGSWDGTWYYVNRAERWAMWMRTRADGQPELKLRYLNTDKAESFVTDWAPAAEYVYRTALGRFRIEIAERDANLIRGSWHWALGEEGKTDLFRTEQAQIAMYRGGDGRSLVMTFEGFERIYKTKSQELHMDPPVALTFQKASRRQASWDELPF